MQCGSVESFAAVAKITSTPPVRTMASDPVPSATELASRGTARPARRTRREKARIAYGQSLRMASLIARLLYASPRQHRQPGTRDWATFTTARPGRTRRSAVQPRGDQEDDRRYCCCRDKQQVCRQEEHQPPRPWLRRRWRRRRGVPALLPPTDCARERAGDELIEANALAVSSPSQLAVKTRWHAQKQTAAIACCSLPRLRDGVPPWRFSDGVWSRHAPSVGALRVLHNAIRPPVPP